MNKEITWDVTEDWNRVVLTTCSFYAMPEDTEIIVKHEDLYETMKDLTKKYCRNTVGFQMEKED